MWIVKELKNVEFRNRAALMRIATKLHRNVV